MIQKYPPLWITWENQRRNREISRRVGATLFELDQVGRIKNPVVKYIYGIWKTVIILYNYRPKIVFCQNPSIILSLFVCGMGRLFRFKAIVDAHNAGLFPLEGRSKPLLLLSKIVQNLAFLTLVSNEALKAHVDTNGGHAFVLPDPIPEFKVPQVLYKLNCSFNLLYICSFSEDEPFDQIIEAARLIDNSSHIYITGNYHKININFDRISSNVSLLGYINEYDYVKMLYSIDATIVLTTRENCLLCGAYESVAAGKPMILSGTKALKHFFYKGAVYTEHRPQSIANTIKILKANYETLKNDVISLSQEKNNNWSHLFRNLMSLINS